MKETSTQSHTRNDPNNRVKNLQGSIDTAMTSCWNNHFQRCTRTSWIHSNYFQQLPTVRKTHLGRDTNLQLHPTVPPIIGHLSETPTSNQRWSRVHITNPFRRVQVTSTTRTLHSVKHSETRPLMRNQSNYQMLPEYMNLASWMASTSATTIPIQTKCSVILDHKAITHYLSLLATITY